MNPAWPSLAVTLGLLSLSAVQPPGKPSLSTELPRIKPLSPAEALKSFQIERGFRIELVASEPDVVDPIALAFDENGRLYVAEDRDYPFRPKQGEKPLGRVRLLTPDEKGRYTASTIFADGVHWPSGIACFKGGVFVAAPPQILYLKDTDGDGKADVREVVFDGFGTAAAEDIMNNLKWGLDNRIYGATSYNGGEAYRPDRPGERPISVHGRDFRFDPVTRRFEALAGTGDFGNCFDDWGNRFVANAGQLLIHSVLPGPYLERHPFLSPGSVLHPASASKRDMHSISPPEPWRVVRKRYWQRWVDTTPEMRASRFSERELAEKGFVTGGAGCEIYRGSAFASEYHGDSFTAEPAGNVVIRLKLRSRGVTFDAEATDKGREFLASKDNWFRPVNVSNGPDGCLYVCDMYREVIEDPSAIPDDILKLIDVTAGRDRGRVYRIVPDGFRPPPVPKLGRAGTKELVQLLEHADAWQRQTSQRLLFERQDRKAAAPLRDLLARTKKPLAQLHALWTLDSLGELDETTLLSALKDAHPSVREHAVRLAESRLSTSAGLRNEVLRLAEDRTIRIRFQVALSLGELKGEEALKSLASILGRDAGDHWITTAVLSSVAGREPGLFLALIRQEDFLESPAAERVLGRLAGLAAVASKPADLWPVLEETTRKPLSDRPAARREILLAVADGLARSDQSLRELLAAVGDRGRAVSEQFTLLLTEAEKTAGTATKPGERVQAIRLLRHAPPERASNILASLLNAREPLEVQLAAVQAISARPGSTAARTLLEHYQTMSPRCHPEVIEALFREKDRIEVLLDALQAKKLSASDLGPSRMAALRQHPSVEIRRRAALVVKAAPSLARKEVLQRYQAALKLSGDAGRGTRVFAAHCAACHRLGGTGNHVGPDLTGVGKRTPDELLVAILDPNREVSARYVNYTLTTMSGRVLTGMLAAETLASVTLRRAEGTEDTVLRGDIEELAATRQSLMPEGLEQQIGLQQMADLFYFLRGSGTE